MMSVQVYQITETMPVMSQGGLNPHPVFPQWNYMDIYPNQFWGSTGRHKIRRNFRLVYLENEYLKVGFNLEIGGRVWSIYDKLATRQAINYASGVWSYNAGFGKNYTCGGMEVNYPQAHSSTTRLPREHRTFRHEDGSVSVVISEYEQRWRTRWSITYTLRPGCAVLEMTVRLYNRTPHDTRYMYWSNCGFPLNNTTEFIFPESSGAMHGHAETTFSWPMWRGKDQGFWKNTPEPLGLYMLEPEEPFFGYYDHDADCGLVHYADLADLPGKKYWSWGGEDFMGHQILVPSHHPDGQAYGEIQAGRIIIQEHLDRVPPQTEQTWTEYWYPVRGTGRYHGAGRDAVIRAEIKEADKTLLLHACVLGTGTFPKAQIVITCGSHAPIHRKISLCPEKTAECVIPLAWRPETNQPLVVTVKNEDGKTLGDARIKSPSPRDSWTEVPALRRDTEPVCVEKTFQSGEALARDWYKHDPRAVYEESLRVDPGFSSAHLELAKLDIQQGKYASAIEHLTRAVGRNEDSLEIRYFLGLALELSGQLEPAQRAYELACRYDYEPRSRVRLAHLRMRQGDFHQACEHLVRVRSMAGRLTHPRGLLSACFRHLNRFGDAEREIQAALEIDPTDPFLQAESLFVKKAASGKKTLLDQVDGYEPPILEGAFDYGNAGLYSEALAVIQMIPKPGPMALFYKAWLLDRSGHQSPARKTLLTACRLDPVGHHAWRLEMIPVLEWAIEQLPKNSRPYYHLGNLKMARGCTQEGTTLWQKAADLGETCYLVYAALGYDQLHLRQDVSKALTLFQKAETRESRDLYVKAEIAAMFNKLALPDKTIRYLTVQPEWLKKSPLLAYHLLEAYLAKKQFTQFDQFCQACDFSDNWQIQGPYSWWVRRHILEGLSLMENGKFPAAVKVLLKGIEMPPNICPHGHWPDSRERIYYHVGRCYEHLGQLEKAGEYWQKTIEGKTFIGWESGFWYWMWRVRYFQALAHTKLGNLEQANTTFDAIESVAKNSQQLPLPARQDLMDLVRRGRLAPDHEKDPYTRPDIKVATTAEL